MAIKEASNVPGKPIVWRATFKGETRLIHARLWFEAITIAAVKFGCSPDELMVERL